MSGFTKRVFTAASLKMVRRSLGGPSRNGPIMGLLIVSAMALCAVAHAASPLAVVTGGPQESNPFAPYLSEILRGEGFTTFDEVGADALEASALAGRSVVLLAETPISEEGAKALREYVQSGGLLVAMRPAAGLHDVFGILESDRIEDRLRQYVVVNANDPALTGFEDAVLQYHGPASKYALQGATAAASLREDPEKGPGDPAITVNRFGRGTAVAFAFDLAKNVVLTRQGNPEWAGDEGDTHAGYRPMDSFQRIDGRTWFDEERLAVPHADELQRVLGRLIVHHSECPLPRLWPLPKMHDVVVVNTGDGESDHGPLIDSTLDACAAEGGAFSVYLMTPGIANTSVEHEARWREAGHETGIHFYADGKEGAGFEEAMREDFTRYIAAFVNKFGHSPKTIRNHTIDWTGWIEMAAIQADHGIRLDTNYYHYLMRGNPREHYGTFTGTTLPQRMMDENGKLLSIYQATTQWCDEWFDDKLLTPDETLEITKGMIADAREMGYPSAFVVNIHPVRFRMQDDITSDWIVPFWKYLREDGIPSWSAAMLLDFVEAKVGSKMEDVRWETTESGDSVLAFRFLPGAKRDDLTLVIPKTAGEKRLDSISLDAEAVEPVVRTVKGVRSAFVTVPAREAVDVRCVYAR